MDENRQLISDQTSQIVDLQTAEKRVEQLEFALNQVREQSTAVTADREHYVTEAAACRRDLTEERERNRELEIELRAAKEELTIVREREEAQLNQFEMQLKTIEGELYGLMEHNAALTQREDMLRKELRTAEKTRDQYHSEYSELKQRLHELEVQMVQSDTKRMNAGYVQRKNMVDAGEEVESSVVQRSERVKVLEDVHSLIKAYRDQR